MKLTISIEEINGNVGVKIEANNQTATPKEAAMADALMMLMRIAIPEIAKKQGAVHVLSGAIKPGGS